jgi:hypothetical protein
MAFCLLAWDLRLELKPIKYEMAQEEPKERIFSEQEKRMKGAGVLFLVTCHAGDH